MEIKVKGHEVIYRDANGALQEHFIIVDKDKAVDKANAGDFLPVEGATIISARKKTKTVEVTAEQIDALINPKA